MSSSLSADADMSKTSVYDSFRQSYSKEDFLEKDLKSSDPVEQFDVWFKTACDTKMEVEPNAAALATSTRYAHAHS
jgi:pyridoxine/pyridoxamine 5'-phosphate oxidase